MRSDNPQCHGEGQVRTVLGVIPDVRTGVSYARFFQPFEGLDGFALATLGARLRLRRGPSGWVPDPGLLDGVDAVVFPQLLTRQVLPDGSPLELTSAICSLAETRGLPVVYSADDDVSVLDATNPARDRVRGSQDELREVIERTDAFVVSTAPLAARFGARERPVHVLPNAVDPARFALRPRRGDRLRLGWAGSASHIDDLLMIVPALTRLRRRVDFDLILFGLTERPVGDELDGIVARRATFTDAQRHRAERFRELADALQSLDARHVPFQPLERFFTVLPSLDLDIGICPLRDTPFNRHKSALKFYEYAITGSLTVASRAAPYEDEVSVLIPEDPTAWCDTLERYLRDDDARERELAGQRDYVLDHRTTDRVAPLWARALGEILDGGKQRPLRAAAASGSP